MTWREEFPIIANTGRLYLKGYFFQVNERIEISLVEVLERVGKSVILLCRGPQTKKSSRRILWL